MDGAEIEGVLAAAEQAVEAGSGLAGIGFWRVVSEVKRDASLVEAYADRIAAIDRKAFEAWALVTVPAVVGTAVMGAATIAGLGLVWWAYAASPPWNGLLLLAGMGVTLVTTHGLAHLVSARFGGMAVTHWFIGTYRRPQPGVKVDYGGYLRAPARTRAWMHASGAIVTKLIPFLAVPPALVMDAPAWTVVVLAVLGVGQIVTDVLWSTKASDWKKFRREMAFVK